MGRRRLAPDVPITWDPVTARYRQGGRFVARDTVLAIVDDRINRGIDLASDYLAAVTDGGAPVEAWQTAMARELKRVHLHALASGKGGWDQLTQADYGRVGARLREQYAYLRNFAQEVADGQLSEAQIRARMAMYSRSARTALFDGELAAKRAAGFTQKRRVLNPAEHCADCTSYAARGWVAIDDNSLPMPGKDSECRTNCKCDLEYR
jgi:hypothetical protein